jgi:hypothetical protein
MYFFCYLHIELSTCSRKLLFLHIFSYHFMGRTNEVLLKSCMAFAKGTMFTLALYNVCLSDLCCHSESVAMTFLHINDNCLGSFWVSLCLTCFWLTYAVMVTVLEVFKIFVCSKIMKIFIWMTNYCGLLQIMFEFCYAWLTLYGIMLPEKLQESVFQTFFWIVYNYH